MTAQEDANRWVPQMLNDFIAPSATEEVNDLLFIFSIVAAIAIIYYLICGGN